MYKKFIKPIGFLLAGCVILLLSDLGNRKNVVRNSDVKRIAIYRFNSNQILLEAEQGFMDSITQTELYKNGKIVFTIYSAEGDLPTANTIAKNIINQKFDLVVSISTPGLQTMANANKDGMIDHIFSTVTDPYGAGVGITGPGPDEHPPHLAGIGSFQPVEELFRMARMMNPDLKKVGVVWCTSQDCSEACVKEARIICEELGIELEEKTVESVNEVYQATLTLCSDQVEALYIGGDNVVEPAMDIYIKTGLKFGIPVITNSPVHSLKGSLLSLGADYYQIGQITAELVDSVLNGISLRSLEVNDVLPEKLYINDSIREVLKDRWIIPPELESRIDSLIK